MKNKDHVDLRIQKTRQLLHHAFTELMEERGFEGFTVGELCDRAMIRRATFYKHFPDKYEYFTFYMTEIVSSFHGQLKPGMEAQDVNAYALELCRELIRFVKAHSRFIEKAMVATVAPTTLTVLLDLLHREVKHALENAGNTGLTQDQLEGQALFFTGGVLSMLFRYLQTGRDIDEEKFIGIVSGFLF